MIKKNYIFIEYLRAVAAISVAIAHVYGLYIHDKYPQVQNTIGRLLLEMVYTGGFGVCLFFLISGFIIPLSFSNFKEFAVRRFFRIYPAFLAACIMAFFIMNQEIGYRHILAYSLVLADLFNAPRVITGVEWTLRMEIVFYIYIGILMWKRKLNYKAVFTAAFAILALNILTKGHWEDNRPLPLIYFYILLTGVIFYFNHMGQLARRQIMWLSITTVLLFIITFQIFELKPYRQLTYPFLAIVVFYLSFKYQNKFAPNKVVTFFSNCSYSLYLLHNFVFKYAVLNLAFLQNIILIHMCAWSILIATCYLLHAAIEQPFINLGKKLSKRYRVIVYQEFAMQGVK